MPLDTVKEIEKIQSFISKHQKTRLSELLTSEGKFFQDFLALESSLSEVIQNELSYLAKEPLLPLTQIIDANASKAEIKNKLDQLEEKLQQQLPEDKQPEIRKKIRAIQLKLTNKKNDVPALLTQIAQIERDLFLLRKKLSNENIRKVTDISLKNRLITHQSIQDLIESLPEVTALARCLEFIKLTRGKSIHIHRSQPSTDQTISNGSPITTLQGLLDIKTDYWASVKLSIVKEKRKDLYWFADIEPKLNKQKEKSLSSRLLKNTTENSPQAPKNLSSTGPKQHLAKTAPENLADANNDREKIALLEENIKSLQNKITSLTLEIQQLTEQNTMPQVSLQDPMDQYNDPNHLASLISQIEVTQRKNEGVHHRLEEDSDYAEHLESATNDQVSLLLLIAEKERRINELKDRITQIETNPLNQEHSTKEIAGTLRNLLRKNQEQEKKLAAEKEKSTQLKAKIKGLEEEKRGRNIDGNQELLDEYLTQLVAQDHQLQEIQHELETEITQLKEVLTEDESKIQSLTTKKAELENQLQTQRLEEKSLRDTLPLLTEKEETLKKTQENLAQLQSRFSSLSDEKEKSDQTLRALKETLENHQTNASEQINYITAKLEATNYQLQEKKTATILSNEIAQLQKVLTENTSALAQEPIQAGTQQKKIQGLNDQLDPPNTQAEEKISNKYRRPLKSRIMDSSARANHQEDPMPEQLIDHEEKISPYGHITPPLTNREEECPTTILNGEHSLSSSVSLDSIADETEIKSPEISLASSEEPLNKETQTIVLTEPENNSVTQQLNDRMSQAYHGIKALFLEKAQQLINSNPSEQNLGNDAEALANKALMDPYHETLLSDLTARVHKIYQDNKEDNAANLQDKVQQILSEKEEEIQKALEETFVRMEEVEAEKHKTNASLIPDLNHSTILLKLEQIAYGALAVGLDTDSYIASQTTLIGLKRQLRTLVQSNPLTIAKANLEQELVNDETTPEQIVALITDEDTLNDRLIKVKADQSKSLIEQVHELAQNAVILETKNHQNKTPEDLEKEWRITLGFIQNADIRLQLALHNATSRELLVFTQEEQDYLKYLSSCIEIKDLEQKKYHLSQKIARTDLTNSEKNTYHNSIQLIEQISQNKGRADSHSLILGMLEKPLVACIQKNDQTSEQAIIRSAGLSHLFKLTQSTDELEQARIELQNKLASSDRSPNAFAAIKKVSTHEALLFEPGSTLLEAARITTRKGKESTFIYKTVKTAHITEFSIDSINGDIRPTTIKKHANHRDFIRFSTQSMLEFAQGSGEKPEAKGMGILILNTNDPGWQQRLAYIKAHQAVFPSQKTAPLIFLEGKYTNAALREPRCKGQLEKLIDQYIQEYNKEKELASQSIEIPNERTIQTMFRGRGT